MEFLDSLKNLIDVMDESQKINLLNMLASDVNIYDGDDPIFKIDKFVKIENEIYVIFKEDR